MSYLNFLKYYKFIASFENISKFEKRETYIYKYVINRGV